MNEQGDLNSVVEAESGEDARYVRFYRWQSQVQFLSDFRVGSTPADREGDVSLPLAEYGQARLGRCGGGV